MKSYNYLVRISYIGEGFHGVVLQREQKTVLGEILRFFNIKNFKISIVSRTDKGVNADENYFVISTDKELDFSKFNVENIKILNVYRLTGYINIRKFSTGKLYEYRLPVNLFDKVYKPRYLIKDDKKIILNYEKKDFDFNLYLEASKSFIGEKSFHNFCKGKCDKPICKIFKFEVKKLDNYYINIIEGNRFLYEMIRRIITFLISVGHGLYPIQYIDLVFDYKIDPKPFPAEAKYLTLKKVYLDWKKLYNYIEEIVL